MNLSLTKNVDNVERLKLNVLCFRLKKYITSPLCSFLLLWLDNKAQKWDAKDLRAPHDLVERRCNIAQFADILLPTVCFNSHNCQKLVFIDVACLFDVRFQKDLQKTHCFYRVKTGTCWNLVAFSRVPLSDFLSLGKN